MKVVYLIGPYRSASDWRKSQNIERAAQVSRTLWGQGYAVICPHTNTRFFSGEDIEEQIFLDGNLELMRRCDLCVCIPGFSTSEGSLHEIKIAQEQEIPIYCYFKERNFHGLVDLFDKKPRIFFEETHAHRNSDHL